MFKNGLTSARLSIFWSVVTKLFRKRCINCFTDYLEGMFSSVGLNYTKRNIS